MNFNTKDFVTLRTIREDFGLSQVEMASLIGCSACQLSTWERGIRLPGKRNLKKLEAFIGGSLHIRRVVIQELEQ